MKTQLTALLAAACVSFAAGAHEGAKHAGHSATGPNLTPTETAFGRTGDPKRVNRTIDITMSDGMRFAPAQLNVRQGETVRLRVRNAGKLMHELVIGTDRELAEHAEMMKKHPTMEHDEPYMAHVPSAQQGEIVWQFTQPGTFKFACLIPGHFEAGMVGTIVVEPRNATQGSKK